MRQFKADLLWYKLALGAIAEGIHCFSMDLMLLSAYIVSWSLSCKSLSDDDGVAQGLNALDRSGELVRLLSSRAASAVCAASLFA